MYHIDQNNQQQKRIFYYIDSFCIINTCLSRIINPNICLMLSVVSFFSLDIKKIVYLDLPVNLYIATQYLKSFYHDS